jgi:iron complex transport system ATP-binding protein
VLEFKHLSCGYGHKVILKDINFKIWENEFVGIIGPNGSGKTTLLRAISNIIKPQKGEVLLHTKDISTFNINALSKIIALVSQINENTFDMSVEEFVLLGRMPFRKNWQFFEDELDERIALSAMELTGTLSFKDRQLSSLSSGEKQLILIARALAQEPKVLLLDEPTAHLDIAHQLHVLDLLRKLNRGKKLSIIIVLHDLNLAAQYCEKILLLSDGGIRKFGAPEEVLTYQTIEEVYKSTVVVERNPITKKPFVMAYSCDNKKTLK